MGANFSFVNSSVFRSSSIDVYDTSCDAHSTRGNYQSQDAYGRVYTYASHDNNSGCRTSVRWSNLTGSHAYGVRYLRARAHTNGTSRYGYSSWYQNPYWG
jgi:hypothetical protein